MLFLIFSDADVLFTEREFTWKSYIYVKTISITRQVQILNHKKFVVTALDLGEKAFVIYIAHLRAKMQIYLTCKT